MSLTDEQKLEAYRLMWVIRRFEERCAQLYAEGEIGGFLHLYIGQEAIAAAVRFVTEHQHNVITAYRDHGLALAKRLPTKNIMAEMLGRSTGVSRGRGGSMHLGNKAARFWGGWAIVGGHLPLASGLALADHYRGDERATICLMGDGATNIGYFHEALNLSGVWDLPVVWVIENNEYGMGTSIARASAVTDLTKKALAYDMPSRKVDGGDVNATYQALSEGVDYVLSGRGPVLIEAQTYRFRGHSMGDAEKYRESDEVEDAKKRDPLLRWHDHLLQAGLAEEDELDAIVEEAEQEIEDAVEFAKNSPMPTEKELMDYVYV